ncbi:zinc finger, C3HC4 type, domain containing protein [Musa troglodytarum]|nr:zinc finger, C3HC4 type, domain containing protein [Musa troglodytarum]
MYVRDDISGKMVLNLDLNFPPLECWLAEGTSGSRHPWISITQIGDAIESQGSTAPPSDRLNNSIIDLESIEDEVVTLASSRGFPQGRDYFRRSQPVTVVPDEDLGINYRRAEQRVARSSSNTRNKRARSSTSRTIINCDLYPDLEQDHIAKMSGPFGSSTAALDAVVKGLSWCEAGPSRP